jgi:hypothetical protein
MQERKISGHSYEKRNKNQMKHQWNHDAITARRGEQQL